jgi:hypothetical protein
MVPTTWLSLLLFLFVVSPGVLFDLLESRRRVSAAESTFREIGRVVLGSLGFTVIALALLLLARLFVPHQLPDPKALITGGGTYFASHYALMFAAIGAETVLAHGIAYLLHVALAKRSGGDTIRQMSAWSKVFRSELPRKHAVYARLRLSNGTVFSGQVAHFTADLPLADREIILTRPLASKTGTNPLTPLPNTYRYAVIRGSAIETMAVEHRPAGGKVEPVPKPPTTTTKPVPSGTPRTIGIALGALIAGWSLAKLTRKPNNP